MMEVTEIHDSFDCARLTKASQLLEDGNVDGSAFALRQGERSLSWNCLSLLPGARQSQFDALRAILARKLNVRKTSRLAVVNVGYTRKLVKQHADLKFKHEPQDDDPTHCGMYGLEMNDEVVQDMIAESVSDTVPAVG